MRRCILFLCLFLFPVLAGAQAVSDFEVYFTDSTMRVDYYHAGDAAQESITLDQVYRQGVWAGNPKSAIDSFNNGRYYVKLYAIADNRLIYSRGYSTIFNEYQTTTPAIEGTARTYHETVLVPHPKNPVLFVIESRDKKNILNPVFEVRIDPDDIAVNRENPDSRDMVYEAVKNGPCREKVDLVFIGEGYTAEQWKTFKSDVDRYAKVLFSTEPYKTLAKAFNITGVLRPSAENGVDEPRKKLFKNTSVNSSFNALNSDRYLLTEDTETMMDIAAKAPFDAIVILVNSERYGGGGIYNFYSVNTVNHSASENVFLHEFGHSFAGLGDEYYDSEVSYNEFYPRGVEPTEANVTALLDPGRLKWKELVSPGVALPTDWGKEKVEAVQEENRKLVQQMREAVAALKDQTGEEGKKVEQEFRDKIQKNDARIREIRDSYKGLKNTVGAFEGAGYSSKGLYRPMMECIMFSNREKKFCKVCEKAIVDMIRFYEGNGK